MKYKIKNRITNKIKKSKYKRISKRKNKKKYKINRKGNEIFKKIRKTVYLLIIIIFIIYNIKSNKEEKENLKDKNSILQNMKGEEYDIVKSFLECKDMPKNPNDPLILESKKYILQNYSKNIGKNLTSGISIYASCFEGPFGNLVISFNKIIFYCEIIGCKKIILKQNNSIYINKAIYDKKYNLTIEIAKNLSDIKENDLYEIQSLDGRFFYNFHGLKVENRFKIFKKEILRNLPKIKTNKKDLYIHIRGGDIYNHKNDQYYSPDYSQPPLCFYQKIIEGNKFRNIYIISENKENIIIDNLMKKYNNITYNNNTLEIDIAYLSYAYNLVGSMSSFLIATLNLNDNLRFFWEYDRYPLKEAALHLHHSVYNFKRKYYIMKMKPSEIYEKTMRVWSNSDEQIKLMLEDTCPYGFTRVKRNI